MKKAEDGLVWFDQAVMASEESNEPNTSEESTGNFSTETSLESYDQNLGDGLDQFFYYNGGIATREGKVWFPNSRKKRDKEAAFEAARVDAARAGNELSNKKRPNAISVCQDRNGKAIGGYSVRGKDEQMLSTQRISNKHKENLDSIHPDLRGSGHGYCAEQATTHNARKVHQKK